MHGLIRGVPPALDLTREAALQRVLVEGAAAGLIRSAHDCAEGGLAVTLAECCFDTGSASTSTLPAVGQPAAGVWRHRDAVRRIGVARRRVGRRRARGRAAVAGRGGAGVPAASDRHASAAIAIRIVVDGRSASWTSRSRDAERIWSTAIERVLRTRPRDCLRPYTERSVPGVEGSTDVRQVQGRVRRVRDLRPPRGLEPHLPRPVRAAAPRPGERRHRRVRRHADPRVEGDGVRQRGLRQRHARRSCRATWPIGHVRYSTAGESRLANAQPIVVDSAHGQLALGHNGNLVNAGELRDALVRERRDLPDHHRHRGRRAPVRAVARGRGAEAAIVDAMSQVRGAFSFVMMTKDRLIGARDPHGFRPLALGRLRRRLGDLLRDLRDGPDRRHLRPRRRARRDRRRQRARPAGRSSRSRRRRSRSSASSSTSTSRGPTATCSARASTRCGPSSAGGWRASRGVPADVVVPIPDSGVCAAVGYAEASGIPMRMGLIRNHYVGRTFIEPQQSIRHFGVRVKLNPVRSILEGKRVVLVDDSIVRGTTSRKIVRMVRERRRARSAHAHQLPADDLAVLLRRGHAAALGADCRDAHARGDPQVPRRRQRGVSEPRRPDRRRAEAAARSTARRATPASIRWRSRATRPRTCSWR